MYENKKEKIVQLILDLYQPLSTDDVQDIIRDLLGPIYEKMLQNEMDNYLGYLSNSKDIKKTPNRRNGYITKSVITNVGKLKINVPRDRNGTFSSKIIPKRVKNISNLSHNIIYLYSKGIKLNDISNFVYNTYGFTVSNDTIIKITDTTLSNFELWNKRHLCEYYPFLFIDSTNVNIKSNLEIKEYSIITMLGYDIDGKKDILGIWLSDKNSVCSWTNVFQCIKNRGVKKIFFISTNELFGIEESVKKVYSNVVIQKSLLYLIRKSLHYVPCNEYKEFTFDLKLVYDAPNLSKAKTSFNYFVLKWSKYHEAVHIWKRNFKYIEQLFNYTNSIKKLMYTANAIEPVISSFSKITKSTIITDEKTLLKLLYFKVIEFQNKWKNTTVENWSVVADELNLYEK